jgi:hypothetical protein
MPGKKKNKLHQSMATLDKGHSGGEILQQTCFDDIHADIFDASLDLLLYETRRDGMNGLDARRILSSKCCCGRHGIAAMGC